MTAMKHHAIVLRQTALAAPEWVAVQDAEAWLTAGEMERWQSFASARRRMDWLAGRLAVKRLLLETWNITPQECVVGSDGTAPLVLLASLRGINLSLSHSGGWGAASWADTARDGTVGLDIQQVRPVHPCLAARVLTEAEQAQAAVSGEKVVLFWALKEAAIKARRLPWTHAMNEIAVTLTGAGTAQIALLGERELFSASYCQSENFWQARAVRPSPGIGSAPKQG